MTGGTGVVASMAPARKSKARERFEEPDARKPSAPKSEPDPEGMPKPEFVIVDHDISPSQARNLERATGAQVLDRTGVIVEIFHRHAHSREAKLQVGNRRREATGNRAPGPANPISNWIAARSAIGSPS
jgi:GTP-binding protein HflX